MPRRVVGRMAEVPRRLQLNYALVTDPADGLAKDGKFDMAGFKNVLKLRAQFEGGTPNSPK
jgi:hypothetical protein